MQVDARSMATTVLSMNKQIKNNAEMEEHEDMIRNGGIWASVAY